MSIKDTEVAFPDIHFPNHDEKAFKCALKVIETIKPSAFLLLETIDGESVSHWQWAKKKRPPLEYQLPYIKAEIRAGNEGLDRIDEVLDTAYSAQKQFTQGNHENGSTISLKKTPTSVITIQRKPLDLKSVDINV